MYTSTTGLPCYHKLIELQSRTEMLQPDDFNQHWWIDRFSAPSAPTPVVLEPETIQTRRSQRRRARQAARKTKQRGAGVNGTRRDPSSFELPGPPTTSQAPILSSLASTLSRPQGIGTSMPNLRFHPYH